MHMADALLSPAVGGAMWAVSAGAIAYCSKKVREEFDERKVPLMGVLGAFIFAAQMINFTIPATGSSGHLGGGLLLTILLGPHAAFLVIASVLVVQSLVFADGGLLALGCNIFNLGFFPAFIAFPCIYRRIVGDGSGRSRIMVAALCSAVAGLQLGACAVVLETIGSGVSALPFKPFIFLMLPIHLAIGVVEGVVTAAVVSLVATARPELLRATLDTTPLAGRSLRTVAAIFLAVAFLSGGFFSLYASERPDGLEWSIARTTGGEKLKGDEKGVHGAAAALQEKLAFLPDYTFRKPAAPAGGSGTRSNTQGEGGGEKGQSSLGTSLAGSIGGVITLGIVFLTGLLLKKKRAVSSDLKRL
jgi:cobalt/nickel transport system permease protein